jgi:hypothetical protein
MAEIAQLLGLAKPRPPQNAPARHRTDEPPALLIRDEARNALNWFGPLVGRHRPSTFTLRD